MHSSNFSSVLFVGVKFQTMAQPRVQARACMFPPLTRQHHNPFSVGPPHYPMDCTCNSLYSAIRSFVIASQQLSARVTANMTKAAFAMTSANQFQSVLIHVFQRQSWGSTCVIGVMYTSTSVLPHCPVECLAFHWTPCDSELIGQLSQFSTFWPRNSTPTWFANRFLEGSVLESAMAGRPLPSMLPMSASSRPPAPRRSRSEYYVCSSQDGACTLLAKFGVSRCLPLVSKASVTVGGLFSRSATCALSPFNAEMGADGWRCFNLHRRCDAASRMLRACIAYTLVAKDCCAVYR